MCMFCTVTHSRFHPKALLAQFVTTVLPTSRCRPPSTAEKNITPAPSVPPAAAAGSTAAAAAEGDFVLA